MTNSNRMGVYFGGFFLGMLLVTFIMMRRAADEERAADAWADRSGEAVAAGYEPLPEALPAPLRRGVVIDFGYLPNQAEAVRRVWILHFRKSYPFVRVVEDMATGELDMMAADQVVFELAEGHDVTELQPMLDQLGLRVRNFNRRENVLVTGVLDRSINAVPTTLEAAEPWAELFETARPDTILVLEERERAR